MRSKVKGILLCVLFLFTVHCSLLTVTAQSNEFTYQGRLLDNTLPPTANYDFQFSLWDALANGTQAGTTQTVTGVAVANGIFTVRLNFGAQFTGAPRFLQIEVRPSLPPGGTYATLAPRQPLTSAPYSIRSSNAANADALSAACNLCVTDGQILSIDGAKVTGTVANATNAVNANTATTAVNVTGVVNGGNIAPGSVTSLQLSPEAIPNSSAYKLLGSLRWDLLKPQANFNVGNNPTGIAFDGTNMWVANILDDTVTKLRASDGVCVGTCTFAVGSRPLGVVFDGASIWVTNRDSDNITKLRASDGANLGTFTVGDEPSGIAFDGANIWVANFLSNNVTKLRASNGENLGNFSAGSRPRGIAFDGANIWVANNNTNSVTKLRASDGSNLGVFSAGGSAYSVVFDGTNIWVGAPAGGVRKLRASDGADLGNFSVLNGAIGLAFDGASIWVAGSFFGSSVTKLRASDGANLGVFTAGNGCEGVAFDGANIWVTNSVSDTVTRLFPAFPQP